MQKQFFRLLDVSRGTKILVQLIADSLLVVSSFVIAMALRYDGFSFVDQPRVWLALVPALPVALVLLNVLGVYRAVIRYIAARALKSVLTATVVSGFSMALSISILGLPVPRTVPILFTMMLFLAVGASRYLFRELVHRSFSRSKERVVIYGSGVAGRQVAQTLFHGGEYRPIAFLDDDPRVQGTSVGGLPVYAPQKIEDLIRNNSITSVLLALPSAKKERRAEILKSLERYNLHLRTIPGLHDMISGRASIGEINDVTVEDLLGRDPVPPLQDLLGANVCGKSVMVTGAGGSIGSELCRQVLRQGPARLVLFESSEIALYSIDQELERLKAHESLSVQIVAVMGSVQNRQLVEKTMRTFRVETVYHAAAYKHVPLVEFNMAEGIRNNVNGTRVVVEAALTTGVESFTLISTDKAVRPTNVMGASKRLAELVCQAFAASAISDRTTISIVRFGNVLGSSGSVIPLFKRQIAAGGPITVTHREITRFFMTIPEAAQLVIQAGAMAHSGDVFLLDMGEPVRIAELAAKMARLHGLTPVLQTEGTPVAPGEIGIVFTHLRPGEKLYEELLIGIDQQATPHPRIIRATETHLPMPELLALLDQMDAACDRNDATAIRRLLIEAKTAYQPQGALSDYFAADPADAPPAQPDRPLVEAKRLSLVRN